MVFIFLGPPGCGKGTLSLSLHDELGCGHLSTGDLLRKEIEAGTPLGTSLQTILRSGALVGDDIVFSLLKERIEIWKKSLGTGGVPLLILDGFPRTLYQAEQLDVFLRGIDERLFVLRFVLDTSVLIKRIVGRFSCVDCGSIYNDFLKMPQGNGVCDECGSSHFIRRSDDSEDVLNNRLGIYLKEEAILLDYFHGRMRDVDATRSPYQIRDWFLKEFGFKNSWKEV